MVENNFWEDSVSDKEKLRIGSDMPPVTLYISMIEIAKINTKEAVVKTVVLNDGRELDIEIMLNTDRDTFTRELKEVLDGETKDSS